MLRFLYRLIVGERKVICDHQFKILNNYDVKCTQSLYYSTYNFTRKVIISRCDKCGIIKEDSFDLVP